MSENGTVPATPMRERTAEEIRVLLARRRMSGAELARRIGKPQPYLSRRLTGEVALDVDDLTSIARVLGVTPGDLLPTERASLAYPDGRHAPRTPVSLITGHHRPVTPRIADHRLRRPERVN